MVDSPKGPLVISTSGANEIIGEIGIFGDVPRTATVTATSRVEALKISKELFINIIRQNPDAAIEVLRVLATRLANTTKQLTRTVGGTK
jgi:CRP-like cAMP-binding protein